MAEYVVRKVLERGKSYENLPDYAEKMEEVLNEQAEAGYRLHTVLSSVMLSQGVCFDGSARPKTFLIFEKI